MRLFFFDKKKPIKHKSHTGKSFWFSRSWSSGTWLRLLFNLLFKTKQDPIQLWLNIDMVWQSQQTGLLERADFILSFFRKDWLLINPNHSVLKLTMIYLLVIMLDKHEYVEKIFIRIYWWYGWIFILIFHQCVDLFEF